MKLLTSKIAASVFGVPISWNSLSSMPNVFEQLENGLFSHLVWLLWRMGIWTEFNVLELIGMISGHSSRSGRFEWKNWMTNVLFIFLRDVYGVHALEVPIVIIIIIYFDVFHEQQNNMNLKQQICLVNSKKRRNRREQNVAIHRFGNFGGRRRCHSGGERETTRGTIQYSS